MKKSSKERNPVSEALRSLRVVGLNESQQEFAQRLNIAIRTVARYESGQPPHGKALGKLARLALDLGFNDQAAVFRVALENDMGVPVPIPQKGPTTGVGFRRWSPEEQKWIKALEVLMDQVKKHGGEIEPPRNLGKLLDAFHPPESNYNWAASWEKTWRALQKVLQNPYVEVSRGIEVGEVEEMQATAIRELHARGRSIQSISKALNNLPIDVIQEAIKETET